MAEATETKASRPRHKRWVRRGIVVLVLAIPGYFYFRDDPLDDFSDLEPPHAPEPGAVYAEWQRVCSLTDRLVYSQEVWEGHHFNQRIDGQLPWLQEPVTRVLDANAEAIQGALTADALGPFRLPVSDWLVDDLAHLSEIRYLARLLKIDALDAYRKGRDEEAVEALLVGHRLGDRMLEASFTLLDWHNALWTVRAMEAAMEQVVSSVPDDAMLRALDSALLAEQPSNAVLQRVFRTEFWLTKRLLESDELWDAVGSHHCPTALLYRKNRTINRAAESFREAIMWAGKAPHQRPEASLSDCGFDGGSRFGSNACGALALSRIIPLSDSAIRSADNARAMRRALRIKIALVRHRRDRGSLPTALMDLVPDYLDAVPLDPYDEKAFRYDRERGVVWSVGWDVVDDGGATERDSYGMRTWDRDPTLWVDPLPVRPEPLPPDLLL